MMYRGKPGTGTKLIEFDEPPAEGPILGYSHQAVANLYAYARNNPVNSTDPSGLQPEDNDDEDDDPTLVPKGNEGNNYKGFGRWEFKSKEDAYKFCELMLPEAERPPGWERKVDIGCIGLNSLRVGDPSGVVAVPDLQLNTVMRQNVTLRTDIEIYKSRMSADKRLDELRMANPEKVFVLTAVQFPILPGRQRRYDALPDGPLSTNQLNGIWDTTKYGDFNLLTLIPISADQSCWEWMNQGLNVKNDKLARIVHRQTLPKHKGGEVYVVVERFCTFQENVITMRRVAPASG